MHVQQADSATLRVKKLTFVLEFLCTHQQLKIVKYEAVKLPYLYNFVFLVFHILSYPLKGHLDSKNS